MYKLYKLIKRTSGKEVFVYRSLVQGPNQVTGIGVLCHVKSHADTVQLGLTNFLLTITLLEQHNKQYDVVVSIRTHSRSIAADTFIGLYQISSALFRAMHATAILLLSEPESFNAGLLGLPYAPHANHARHVQMTVHLGVCNQERVGPTSIASPPQNIKGK